MSFLLSDSLQYLSKLTPRRTLNIAQVISSYFVSKYTKKPVQWGMPVSVFIEPTTSCNLRCPECPSGLRSFTRPTGMLKSDLYEKMLDELAPTLSYLIFYFQGEPYLHPKFLEMVRYAHTKRIYTETSTNAHYLNDDNARRTVESGLDRLTVSIDGTTQETYEQYRVGGSLKKVIEGTTNVIAWKKKLRSKTPCVIFQFLVVKPNEHQVEDAKRLAKELGVDTVLFKTAQIYDYEHGSDLIPTLDDYSRYKKNDDGSYSIKNKLLNHCWKLWKGCVITWDGTVVPCCFDKDSQHALGDLSTTTFKEVWQGEGYQQFRRSILRSRKEIDICKNCTEGLKVFA
ncbi:MAG TPA: SPASM domain-containing protein [Bacteroidota bacterium]|nr:SPASM domain-containing protein [Bacteroidota bacterium]